MNRPLRENINLILAVATLLLALAILALGMIANATEHPAGASGNIRVYIDGQFIGTGSDEVLFNASTRELHITTEEGVIDCRYDVIFRDRFQGRHP